MPKIATLLLKIGISVGLIAFLLSQQDFAQIRDSVLNFNPLFVILSLAILLLGTYISALRWKAILKSAGKEGVSEKLLFRLYLKGYFYNNFLPTQMGGDLYKSVSLGSQIKDQSLSLFSVFMDRFSGLLILLVLSLFGISSMYGWQGIVLGAVLFAIGLAMYFPVLNFASKKIKFLVKFKDASYMMLNDKKGAGVILLYSLLVQAISFSIVCILFIGVGFRLPLWSIFAFLPLASLSLVIPSFNGFGTQDTVYAFLFKGVGVTEVLSITVSVMIHITRLAMSLIGGMLVLIDHFSVSKE